MNRSYRTVWNAALGAFVATGETTRAARLGAGAAAALACLATLPAVAADLHWKGTSFLNSWTAAGSYTEARVPTLADRVIVAGTTASIMPAAGAVAGAIWVQSSAANLYTFTQLQAGPAITIGGLDGVGVQTDSSRMINFFREVQMAGDFAIIAANEAGGGFNFSSNVIVGPSAGILATNGHTVTLAPRHEGNLFQFTSGYSIQGTGHLIKEGAGLVSFNGTDLLYTGSTWVKEGTLRVAGTSSLSNSGTVRVDATLDMAGQSGSTGTLRRLTGSGRVLIGARSLGITEGGSDFAGGIEGSGALILRAGTSTLTGSSSYSGGTQVKGGARVDVGSRAALGTGAVSMDDGSTLGFAADALVLANDVRFTGSADPTIDTGTFTGTLAGAISGAGALTKSGGGTLVLASTANSYTGATTVAQGTLRAGGVGTLASASAHTVAAGATLDLAGFSQTLPSVANGGTVSTVGSVPGTTLTVTGAYVGQGGTLRLGTALGDSGSASDRLLLSGAGASASGRTTLQVVNLGGLGATTTGNGIEVVSASGGATTTAQTTRDAFSLAGGQVDAGVYEYRLFAGDAEGAGENWYLRSTLMQDHVPIYRAETPLIAAAPAQFRRASLSMLANMHQRVGDAQGDEGRRRAWGRVISTDIDLRQGGTVSPGSNGHVSGFQAGTDLWAQQNWRVGVYAGQLEGEVDVTGFARGIRHLKVGRNELRSQFLGVYGTYSGDDGFYADAVLQAARHRFTARASMKAPVTGDGSGTLASIEVGRAFTVAEGWTVQPQLQYAHQRQRHDDLWIPGAVVSNDADSGWTLRAGVRVKGEVRTARGLLQPYARLNLYRTKSGTDTARFVGLAGSTDIATATGGNTGTELALGASWRLTPALGVYGELGRLWSSGGAASSKSGLGGSVGVRVLW